MSKMILKHFEIDPEQTITLTIEDSVINVYNQDLFENIHVLSCSIHSSILDELFIDKKYVEILKYIKQLKRGD